MKTFIADIIPKIQRYSQQLDNITLLTNQHWVVIDGIQEGKSVYIFRPNGELIISTNGRVEKAKWELLGKNSILVDMKNESYLFKHGFFDENVLALKVDSKEEYALLVNEKMYDEGSYDHVEALNYLRSKYFIERKSISQGTEVGYDNRNLKKTHSDTPKESDFLEDGVNRFFLFLALFIIILMMILIANDSPF